MGKKAFTIKSMLVTSDRVELFSQVSLKLSNIILACVSLFKLSSRSSAFLLCQMFFLWEVRDTFGFSFPSLKPPLVCFV